MATAKNSRILRTIPLMIVVFFASIPAYAKYGGGSGEPNDPYLIYTAEQMNTIGAEPNDWDKHFKLMADIDLSAYEGDSFNLIGYRDGSIRTTYPFGGLFDGNGHTLSNLTYIIERTEPGDEEPLLGPYGLFRYLSGEVRDLGLINPTIRPADTCPHWVSKVGALVGYSLEGSIINCYVQGGYISGDSTVGGLVGIHYVYSGREIIEIISDCYASCTVACSVEHHPISLGSEPRPASVGFGGLLGESYGTILRSYAHGDVEAAGFWAVGGLVGVNRGTITHCFAAGRVSGEYPVGGLVGANEPTDEHVCSIVDCYATGAVKASGTEAGGLVGSNGGEISGCFAANPVIGKEQVGGLVGRNKHRLEGSITDCYATGSVMGDKEVGGLVGINPGTISNCYATGPVSGLEEAGGLIGRNRSSARDGNTGTVIACFWNQDTSGQEISDGGFGKSTDQMQDPNTYLDAGWDFVGETVNGPNDIWYVSPGVLMYPKLAWEDEPQAFAVYDFNDNPGWSMEGQWQFGRPQGLGGAAHGHPDPNSGYTGDNVYGVNLSGDYTLTDKGPHYLTAGPIDCSAYSHIDLQFARWLNSDEADYVRVFIEVSTDGANWQIVWEHADTEAAIMDDSWRVVRYPLGSVANYQSDVYIRGGYHILDDEAWKFSGWNIDDVQVMGLK